VEITMLPGKGARLYASWIFAGRPRPERARPDLDLVHATTVIPPPTRRPLVVTVHDVAFLHHPEHFSRWGQLVFRRSWHEVVRRADLVLCSSTATMADCETAGIGADRLRLVPLGVRATLAPAAEIDRVRQTYGLPERFLLFVGTVEPRKNLRRLVEAIETLPDAPPLVAAGSEGWGNVFDTLARRPDRVRLLGFVPSADLPGLYAAASVFCFPSLREGFGLPVLESMAQGTPVVTSRGTSTEEVAGGAAVLVDPTDVRDIARGIAEAIDAGTSLTMMGFERARSASWSATAAATVSAYRELVT
jgi:glycosyltransferase involved in cell wall biosynthesis